MISILKEPRKPEEITKVLHPYVKEWFFKTFKDYSLPQLYGVMEVHEKNNLLLSAPTGGTKTLTSFLAIINELVILADNNLLEDRIYAVYCSPLKALNNDIHRNLLEPLDEIKKIADRQSKELNIRIGVRTGDTTPAQKHKMLKHPPNIFITTPESLGIVLCSPKFKELLRGADYCIIDEIHALAENKRGVHLSLSLERLQDVSPGMVRIGLSATCEPLDQIAQFLVGTNRDCKIANVQFLKKYDMQVLSPLPDLINITYDKLHNALYDLLDKLIQEHKTTLVFTNTRSGTERIVHHLKTRFPKNYTENIGAHHGSLSKMHRLEIEEKLKKGELKAIVSSTSLELGIDIGYIDLVVCVGSPKSIARLLQRYGRAGHQLHETVKGRIVVMDRDDLVECSVMLKLANEKKIDTIHIPSNCLDVLAQQIFGMAIQRRWQIKEIYKTVTSSYCYRSLSWNDFMDVMNYLSGEFASLEDRNVYARIWYDKETGEVGKRGKLSRVIYMTNIGTIPDETSVIVKAKERVIGTIDEGFLERLKRNDIFVLGGETYQFLFSRGMVAQVIPAHEKRPTVPSWFSEMLPLSFDVAMEIQKFRRYVQELLVNKKKKDEILKFIHEYTYVDENAANAIYEYLLEQYRYTAIPHDKKIVIEYFIDEKNKRYAFFHTLYGRRVNDVLSRAVAYVLGKLQHRDVEIGISDNGFFVASMKPMQAQRAFEMIKPDELERLMKLAIDKTEVLKRRFRHCAARALMILREYKGKRKHVGRQQVSSMILLSAVKQISQDFSILKEARREVLEDLMDIHNAVKVMEDVQARKIELQQTNVAIPSPFAFNLATQGYTDILKIEEKVEFIRRMHQNVLVKIGKNFS